MYQGTATLLCTQRVMGSIPMASTEELLSFELLSFEYSKLNNSKLNNSSVEAMGIEPITRCVQSSVAVPWYMRPRKDSSSMSKAVYRTKFKTFHM